MWSASVQPPAASSLWPTRRCTKYNRFHVWPRFLRFPSMFSPSEASGRCGERFSGLPVDVVTDLAENKQHISVPSSLYESRKMRLVFAVDSWMHMAPPSQSTYLLSSAFHTWHSMSDSVFGLVRKPEGKRPLRRPRRRWVDNIRMDRGEVGWGDVDWIDLAQDRNRWRALVNSVLNLRVPWNAGKLCSGLTSSGLSSCAQLHRVS
jgi:hypothetical protein